MSRVFSEDECGEIMFNALKDVELSWFSYYFANEIYQSYKKDGNFEGIHHFVEFPRLTKIMDHIDMTRTKHQKASEIAKPYAQAIDNYRNIIAPKIEENIITYWKSQF